LLAVVVEHELSADELIAAYRAGQRVFRGIEVIAELPFPEVSDAEFFDSEFIECWFHSVNFARVDFSRAKFSHCNVKCATFTQCNLDETHWDDCPVCSLAIVRCTTLHLRARGVHAYGVVLSDGNEFIEYALANAK
jgi:Pentapeptide repeats (9 copies)